MYRSSSSSANAMRHHISRRKLGWTMLLGGFLFVALMFWKMHGSMQELERTRDYFKQEQQQFHPKDKDSKISHDTGDNIPPRLADRKGLSVRNGEFYLDEKPFQILGGSLHYFRFPQEYWYERLHALKACGLNTVTTYIPWNSHEPEIGRFVFSGMLDLQQFIKTAHSMGLYVILRVGPYICAEWEWGGLPSWLLRHKQLRVRTNDPLYLGYVAEYFDKLLSMIVPHQYIYGGPVIAVQVENEYATYSHDPQHVIQISNMIKDRGIKEFLFVCDDRHGTKTNLEYGGLYKAINFQNTAIEGAEILKIIQPHHPMFVVEYWTGWFNTWGNKNNNMGVPWLNSLTPKKFEDNTIAVLEHMKNMNLYMFAGGTNFGFMNGGIVIESGYSPDTTSYDYTALITEEGKLTVKYNITRKLLQKLHPSNTLPLPPSDAQTISYRSIVFNDYLTLFELMIAFKSWMVQSELPITFEDFPSVGDRRAGQAYGYIVYECNLDIQKKIALDLHRNVRDRALVFINQMYQDTVSASTTNYSLTAHPGPEVAITFLVENQGRINWVPYGEGDDFANQRKGFVGNISLAGKTLTKWKMWPFDFQEQFLSKLTQYTSDGSLKWKIRDPSVSVTSPVLLRATMTIDAVKPKDTFLELEGFNKGFVIVNQHNLGRYWNTAGPQRRLFLPGVWLKHGANEIMVFEEYTVGSVISFHTTSDIST